MAEETPDASQYAIKVYTDADGAVKLESSLDAGQTVSALMLSALSAIQKDQPGLTRAQYLAICNGIWEYQQKY